MMTRNECAAYLEGHDGYLILTHRRPDGDTVGSAATLCRGLRQLGKTAHILKNPEVTEKYTHLHEGLTKDTVEDGDIIVSVDVASPGMLPGAFEHLKDRITLRIDHHYSATSFTEVELVDHTAGACAEIIYDVLTQMGVKLDKEMAEALYTAVSTDTGCFRYANTTAHSFLTAAACAQAGGDIFGINQAIFETNSVARLRIQGWLVDNARFYKDGRVVVCALPRQVEENIGVTEDDMENISGFPRTFAGVKMAATLRESRSGEVKLSLRVAPGYDASAVCARFGGGGHKGAAGATIGLPLEEAAKAVTDAILEMEVFP